MGGPPGIPGNPLPAEPDEPGFVELGMVPTPCATDGEERGAAGDPPDGSSPFCRLSEDGFEGLAAGELLCAKTEEPHTERMTGRASRRTQIIEASLSLLCTHRA